MSPPRARSVDLRRSPATASGSSKKAPPDSRPFTSVRIGFGLVPDPWPRHARARETLRKIRRIQIRTRVILESGIGGAYHAVFKGRGMEFAEVREYAPGDEVRTIDWNVTARMGAPYVKKFVEERDLTLLLVVDVSGSQDFGSQYLLKRDYAAELAAVLAFSAVANHDRVGAVLFSDRIEGYVPPGRGPRPRAAHRARPAGPRARRAAAPTSPARCASRSGCCERRGIVAVDLRLPGRGLRARARRPAPAPRRRRAPPRDPREASVPAAGLVAFTDPETGAAASSPTRRGPRCGARCGRPAFAAAQAIFRKTRVDALALSHGRVVRAAAVGLLQGAGAEAVVRLRGGSLLALALARVAGPAAAQAVAPVPAAPEPTPASPASAVTRDRRARPR